MTGRRRTPYAVSESPGGSACNESAAAQRIKGLQDLVRNRIVAAAPQLTAGLL
ncbi:MAG: hypothetical protein ABI881_03795 [Betaproteobacteria bacterium]